MKCEVLPQKILAFGCGFDTVMASEEVARVGEGEEEEFFDSWEGDDMSPYESCMGSPERASNGARTGSDGYERMYGKWLAMPNSVQERRDEFRKWMGITSPDEDSASCCSSVQRFDGEGEGAAASTSTSTSTAGEVEATSVASDRGSPVAGCSCSSENEGSDGNPAFMIKNLDDGSIFVADEITQDGSVKSLRRLGSQQTLTMEELHGRLGSTFVHRMMRRDDGTPASSLATSEARLDRARRAGWLKKLGAAACITDRRHGEGGGRPSSQARRMCNRVGVRSHKKQAKELSAIYLCQEIRAHRGGIWTLKFSPDGKYLASGGEDGIVRVWEIADRDWENQMDSLEKDPSSVYLQANKSRQLSVISKNMEKRGRFRVARSSADSTFVVLPPQAFSILEKPLHEFHGHSGNILSLSWSKSKSLLSSSTDKTVRLWKVGCETCVEVFRHSDYVTCVQFNPMVDNYFVTGSIDGKVRVWDAVTRSVVNWTEIRDIVTAVCYRPDAKGVVAGTMAGHCRFYSILDDHMQLENEVSFHSKKSSCKKITGFQFSPTEPRNLMVTSADSQVRILKDYEIISKYKGLRNVGSQISASFTQDGRHIVSASEDSNVYVWNQSNTGDPTKCVKSSSSYEHFAVNNVTVAIPWNTTESRSHVSTSEVSSSEGEVFRDKDSIEDGHFYSYLDMLGSSDVHVPGLGFSLTEELFVDVIPRGSATWPEEKLPSSSARDYPPTLCKSQYKLLKPYCENRIASHAWGQVIVTAGWDGWIKTFHNYGLPVCA